MRTEETHESVQQYYGEVLKDSTDLKTSACCAAESPPHHIRAALSNIEDEILARFYGCGSPIPPALEGATVLDLGCGTGRDAYVCAQLVGEKGRVIGVDMTEAQLDVARRHEEGQRERFGFSESNVEFVQGYMEDLAACGIEDDSVDVVISNCVLNLAPDKEPVFREILRVLKPGGEIYFSDVFCDRRLPDAAKNDPVLVGECLGGALYTEDFRRLLSGLGIEDYREIERSPIAVEDAKLANALGPANFFSITFRIFNVELEDRCEDYGQVATYKGTIDECRHRFTLDDHHEFVAGKPMLVCGNTARMIAKTRFAPHFEVQGNEATHFGLFDCAPEGASADEGSSPCC